MILEDLNALDRASAERELLRCCGSMRWAREMADGRPFRNLEDIEREADRIWLSLEPADWLEAFAAHPRIGDSQAGGAGGAGRPGGVGGAGGSGEAGHLAAREQAGMDAATDRVRDRIAAVNREYEARFGFIYIVCATGKSADEMLSTLEQRMKNSRGRELPIAAEEQRKITRLRLEQLIT